MVVDDAVVWLVVTTVELVVVCVELVEAVDVVKVVDDEVVETMVGVVLVVTEVEVTALV
ncbi:MAG: hypothetical protein ACLPY5_00760 [Candidatus Bathyarchaeia archaeon]